MWPDEDEDPLETMPLAASDLTLALGQSFLDEVIWISPAAVLTFGQYRQCESRRFEAIMSVIGATEWYDHLIQTKQTGRADENLVHGFYPAEFLNEVAQRVGPSFYGSMHADIGYLAEAVTIHDGKWELKAGGQSPGSALPFTPSDTNMVPPQKYEFSTYDHPSVREWTINDDGSVRIRSAALLTFLDDEMVEKDGEDMIIAPSCLDMEGDVDDLASVEIETQENQDLEKYLNDFSNPSSGPNFAVCLNQQVYFNRDIPGPQTGLLLKQVGKRGNTQLMVKIGLYFTRASRAWDITAKQVDWLIL